MKQIIKGLIVGMLCLSAWAYAETGLLFQVSSSGTPAAPRH